MEVHVLKECGEWKMKGHVGLAHELEYMCMGRKGRGQVNGLRRQCTKEEFKCKKGWNTCAK